MKSYSRSLAVLGIGVLLLVLQGALGTVFSRHPFVPNITLPLVLYLGVAPGVSFPRGAFLSFLLGYLVDVFSGTPLSLYTFVAVATFMLTRVTGLRILLRGPGFQILLTSLVAFFGGLSTIFLRVLYEDFEIQRTWNIAISTIVPAVATGLFAPLIFALVSRVEFVEGRRQEDVA